VERTQPSLSVSQMQCDWAGREAFSLWGFPALLPKRARVRQRQLKLEQRAEARRVAVLFEAGATAKEAQSLMRHSDPRLTMNVYAKTRNPRLAQVAENLGEMLLPGQPESPTGQSGGPKADQKQTKSRPKADQKQTKSRPKALTGKEEKSPNRKQRYGLKRGKKNGGGGNRTPVPRRFHISFYRNSPSFGSRPLGSEGQDPWGQTSCLFSPRRPEVRLWRYPLLVAFDQHPRGRDTGEGVAN
jgi:hypothetical protein